MRSLRLSDFSQSNIREILDVQLDYCFNYTRNSKYCRSLSDRDFIINGIQRLTQNYKSGRHFIQNESELNDNHIASSTFFDALHSSRRNLLVNDICKAHVDSINEMVEELGTNYLENFPELFSYRVMSGDGHFINHASHTSKDTKGKVYAAGSIFGLNVKTGVAEFLCSVTDGSRKNHEIPQFKEYMRANTDKTPTIWIMDRAYISGSFWLGLKSNKQYLISRVKDNMNVKKIGQLDYDKNDPVNTGVTDYYLAAMDSHYEALRVTEYTDPETGDQYRFFSTLDTLKPGLVAWLYFLRWGIEKTFDNFKNSLNSTKAWANGTNAQQIQALLTVMTYNLLRMFTETLKNDGHDDYKAIQKRTKASKLRRKKALSTGKLIHPLQNPKNRMTQISAQFIRTFKNWFITNKPYSVVKQILIHRLNTYL